MLTLANYQIGTQIYESINSFVYRGLRKKDNQPVILKMLKQDYPTPLALTRYRQEYEIIQDFDLAGIIKAYKIEKYQNTLVIILEDFGGQSLKQFRANRPFLLKDFLPIAIQIAEYLGNIHAYNIIHKDINPSNIVVNPQTKQLKIIDFGIASRLPRENPTLKNPEQLEGTLAYISPEQTGRINRSMDYRTDLYSLGVTFYELLTGFVPFTATDAMELVHCHIAKTPAPLCDLNPDVPPILSNIVLKLLAKNADDRYQSAFGLKVDLEKCLALSQKVFGNPLFSTHFELAQNDFSGKFKIPQKLYGRENEINTLLQAFERVSNGTAELMLVAGYSGIGKSALVKEIYQSLTEKKGYFIGGKFDQLGRNIPYSALVNAFKELVQQLLTETKEQLLVWKEKLLTALGPNGQVISHVLPEIEWLIGKQPPVPSLGPTESQNRFHFVFQNFIQVFCQTEHSFVIFLDDLQWADLATLSLIERIMTNKDIGTLFIIAVYRDNEVNPIHPLMITLDKLRKESVTINQIILKPLTFEQTKQLIAESLHHNLEVVSALTDLVMRKTGGNPFFVNQFLQTLYEENLLTFVPPTHSEESSLITEGWQWDIAQIKAMNITDNVVDLMVDKLKKLPKSAQHVLRLAACVGNRFDLETLSVISEKSANATFQNLLPVLAEGLILPTSNLEILEEDTHHELDGFEEANRSITSFRHFIFLHDRVQQAAYALIDDEQKKAVHLKMGRLLLKNTLTDHLDKNLFDIVKHYNFGHELLNNSVEKTELARLNLKAGQKAKAATAYAVAIQYLTAGQACLRENSWQEEYELVLNLYIEAMEVGYLNTNYEQAEKLAEIVLQEAKTLLDKAKVYEIKIQAYAAQNKMQLALKTGLHVLQMLNVSLLESPPANLQVDKLYHLPVMLDPLKLAIQRIILAIYVPAFIVEPPLGPKLAFTMLHFCIKGGNSPEAVFIYGCYGVIRISELEIEEGYQFGQLALKIYEQFEAKKLKCKLDNCFNSHIRCWKEPLRNILLPLRQTIQVGLEIGDLEFCGHATAHYCSNLFLSGESLNAVKQTIQQYIDLLQRIKQGFNLHFVKIWGQLAHNLSDKTADKLKLIGELFDETEFFNHPDLKNNQNLLFVLYLGKTILSYLFKEYDTALIYAAPLEDYAKTAAGLLTSSYPHFYHPLILLAKYPEVSETEQTEFLKKVAVHQQKMKILASHAPNNFQHKYDLVEAEKARVLGQEWQAAKLYDKAIAGAKENQYLHEEALADELAAEFYLAQGMEKIGQTYVKEAHYCYQQWGALAKIEDLESRYPQFFSPKTAIVIPTDTTILAIEMLSTSTKGSSEWLDLNSMIKASQTLSGEIVLSRLLEKMMQIVIENAGASCGFLLLPKQDRWFIEASGQVDSDEVKVQQSLPIENQHLAETIIHYVIRTQENVVLNNASVEGQFIRDPYIVKQHPKSVLCAPLINQGKLSGLLYLENNLTTGAFTPARFEVLKVLASQLAISIENALLYQRLEQKVEERTAQLAQRTEQLAGANKEITLLNEQLKSDNLRMSAELEVSRQLQQMLLPTEKELEAIDHLDLAGFMAPADEVGGDYYDVLQDNGRILFAIGDVTGHGLESGALAIMVQSAVRTLLALNETDPVKFFSALNHMVYHNVQRMNVGKSLTLALVDYQDKQLYLSGQHEEMIVVRQGELELIDTVDLGFPIGLDLEVADFIAQIKVPLNRGDVVVLYTDGITEAENIDGLLYGLERLCQIIQQNWQEMPQEIRKAVIDDVRQFIGEQKVYDDITLLVLKQK